MTDPISILILENDLADFELITHELRRSGFNGKHQRAETEAEYLVEIQNHPDIILADYVLTGFDALRALEILQQSGLLIPFIVITGAVHEDTVVQCMKRGASDYLLKDRVLRLGPAIRRALDESELRRQKHRADQALRLKNIELEELFQKAQAASQMKSTFLANMSHELRTPLTAMIGFTELIVDERIGQVSPAQLDLLQDVLRTAKHLQSLINEMLDVAKVDSGTMLFCPKPVLISNVVAQTLSELDTLAAKKEIVLISDVRLPPTPVLVDALRLNQVLSNYISNAIKFTAPKGIVTIRVFLHDPSFFRLEVEDTGIGIEPENIARLFQDFQQLEDGLSKEFPGTGLGLALTKRLVEAQGGSVGVTSVHGQGSTFFAVLPYACADELVASE